MWNARRVLETLDKCAAQFTFPALDNGYVYPAASRLSIHRSKPIGHSLSKSSATHHAADIRRSMSTPSGVAYMNGTPAPSTVVLRRTRTTYCKMPAMSLHER